MIVLCENVYETFTHECNTPDSRHWVRSYDNHLLCTLSHTNLTREHSVNQHNLVAWSSKRALILSNRIPSELLLACTKNSVASVLHISKRKFGRYPNTIYQWRCKSSSLRQLVQPLFSWFSRLPMTVSVWQAWRSLRHKAGCTLRQSLRLWIRWVRHRSRTWTDPYSFERVTWQTWCNRETSGVNDCRLCLVRWIMVRNDQWYFQWGPSLDYHYQWYMQKADVI